MDNSYVGTIFFISTIHMVKLYLPMKYSSLYFKKFYLTGKELIKFVRIYLFYISCAVWQIFNRFTGTKSRTLFL